VLANYLYKRAEPDGLTFGTFNNSLIVQHALGDPKIRLDFRKYGWIGAPSVGAPMCMVMGYTGLKTLEDVLNYKKPLKVGATRAGSTGYDLPLIMNKTLGTKFDVVSGYTGTATTRVALQKHELQAFCSQWESMRVTARAMLDAPGGDKLIPFIIHERTWQDPEVKNLPDIQGSDQRSKEIRDLRELGVPNGIPTSLLFASGHAQGPFGNPPQGVCGNPERSGAAQGCKESQAGDYARAWRKG
jgi:hypothetical protein